MQAWGRSRPTHRSLSCAPKDQMIRIEDLSVACARWHVASDAYATQLIMLENGRPDAIQELRRLGAQLEKCRQAVDALTAK